MCGQMSEDLDFGVNVNSHNLEEVPEGAGLLNQGDFCIGRAPRVAGVQSRLHSGRCGFSVTARPETAAVVFAKTGR